MLVSVTDMRIFRARDLPGAYLAAARLARGWPGLSGSLGVWLWGQPLRKRSGAVSVWIDGDALHDFINWPVHVAIMSRYRSAGAMISWSWEAERFDASEIRRRASSALAGGRPS